MKKTTEIFGWYGVCAILIAYSLVNLSILPVTSLWYQALNLTGALGIVIVSLNKKDSQLSEVTIH